RVNSISAGTTNDVSLAVNNANTATSSITSLHPNDGVADVTGRSVSLTATGPTTGNTGQIGFFASGAQFLEVAATTLNASTNNSRLWIAAVGGTAVGSVNAGTNTAFLRAVNGNVTSANVDGTADVVAATVNLSNVGSGSFGVNASTPLEIDATNLNANLANAGAVNVKETAGVLNVVLAKTVNGDINLITTGGGLTLATPASGTT